MEQLKFKLKNFDSKFDFRFRKISPIDILSLQTQIDLENMEKTKKLFSFILENTEVTNNGDLWVNVKEKKVDEYHPEGMEFNLKAMNEICIKFINDIIKPVFIESSR